MFCLAHVRAALYRACFVVFLFGYAFQQGCRDPLQGNIPRDFQLVSNGDWQQYLKNVQVRNIVVIGSAMYVHADTIDKNVVVPKVFRSTDNGRTWTTLSESGVIAIAAGKSNLFIVRFKSDVNEVIQYYPENSRIEKKAIIQQLPSGFSTILPEYFTKVENVTIACGVVYAQSGGVRPAFMRSTDDGLTWTVSTILPFENSVIRSVTAMGNTVFATVSSSATQPGGFKIFRSRDFGISWQEMQFSRPISNFLDIVVVVSGKNTLFGLFGEGLLRSLSQGESWERIGNELNISTNRGNENILPTQESIVFVGTKNGVFRSGDNGNSWSPFNTQTLSSPINCLSLQGRSLFAGTNNGLYRLPLR